MLAALASAPLAWVISGKAGIMSQEGPTANPDSAKEFVQLFSRYQGRLFRCVAFLVPRLDGAEDVLSVAAVMLWNEFRGFEPGTKFLAWARRIAYLRVLEYLPRRDRRFPDDLPATCRRPCGARPRPVRRKWTTAWPTG